MKRLAFHTYMCVTFNVALMLLLSLSIAAIPAVLIQTEAIERLVFDGQWLPLVLVLVGCIGWFALAVDTFVDCWRAISAHLRRYGDAVARRDARRRIDALLASLADPDSFRDTSPHLHLLTGAMRLPKEPLQ